MKHLFLLLRNVVVLFNQTLVNSKQHKITSNGIYESGCARLLCRMAYVLCVLSYVLTFLVHCCDVRYDFRIKTMFGSSLPPVVCRRADVLFMLFVFLCVCWFPTRLDYMSNMVGFLIAYPSRAHGFTSGFRWDSCCSSFLVFCVEFCFGCLRLVQCYQFVWIVKS